MPYADVDDARLYYESAGTGSAVLFAHGAGGNAASWWQQVTAFASDHRVVTFDHRGFGRSACDPEQFSPTRFEHDAIAVLDALGIDRADVVCQSMGGWTGVRLAAFFPDRVRRLVLANTPGALFTDALLARMRELTPRPEGGDLNLLTLGEPYRRSNPAGAHLYRAISAFNTTPMPLQRLMDRAAFVPPSALARTPVLMIGSRLDATFPLAVLEATARLIDAPLHVVDDAGHSTYFERPDVFNAAVRKFLFD